MARRDNDYDSVFKTLKARDTRLFIPVINDALGKNYPMDADIRLLDSDGQLISFGEDGEAEISDRIGDMLISVNGDLYIVECQSYIDNSIGIRVAEYSFNVARNGAIMSPERVILKLPASVVIYVKDVGKIPPETEIVYEAPGGEQLIYRQRNVILKDISKEEILEKRLLAYIPFYVTRYERQLEDGKDTKQVVEDLEYLRNELIDLIDNREISPEEFVELRAYTNTIIEHITNGNEAQKEVTEVMGGGVILPSPVAEMKKEIRQEVWEEANIQLSAKDQQLTAKDEEILTQRERLNAKDQQLTAKDEEILIQRERLNAKDQQLSELEQRNAELEAMVISLGGKV